MIRASSYLARTDSGHISARSRGYILLFTLGVLAVISVLILSMTVSLRMDAQLISREKVRLQDEYTLRGAVQYVIARLGVTLESQRQLAGRALDTTSRRKLWFPNEGPYSVQLGGTELVVHLDDAGVLPDANLLTEQEWQRLFAELGAGGGRSADMLAKAVVESKLSILRNWGIGGFTSLADLLGIQTLPQHLTRGENSEGRPGAKDLLVVGTDMKQLEINHSPLVLFKVLAGFTDNQVDNLKLARSRGPISLAEGQKLLSGSPAKLMSSPSEYIRVFISIKDGGETLHGMYAIVLLKNEDNVFSVKNQLFGEKF